MLLSCPSRALHSCPPLRTSCRRCVRRHGDPRQQARLLVLQGSRGHLLQLQCDLQREPIQLFHERFQRCRLCWAELFGTCGGLKLDCNFQCDSVQTNRSIKRCGEGAINFCTYSIILTTFFLQANDTSVSGGPFQYQVSVVTVGNKTTYTEAGVFDMATGKPRNKLPPLITALQCSKATYTYICTATKV